VICSSKIREWFWLRILFHGKELIIRSCGSPKPQPGETMYSEPIILPLNADGKLYALEDEQGRIVGTGTREICEALLTMMKNETFLFRRLRSEQSDRSSKL